MGKEKFRTADFPLWTEFEQWNYLGVEVVTSMADQYIFTTKCWATPTADPLGRSSTYYPIISNGCPADDYTVLESRLPLEDRFKTETLKFPSSDYVYIQCDVLMCDLTL